ncbi:MAG: hypothetical protein IJF59_05745 [Clostridia bacterium]|nr:hypothetical protein [Clostridia bacterium]
MLVQLLRGLVFVYQKICPVGGRDGKAVPIFSGERGFAAGFDADGAAAVKAGLLCRREADPDRLSGLVQGGKAAGFGQRLQKGADPGAIQFYMAGKTLTVKAFTTASLFGVSILRKL